jgi:hypothetical protein
MCKELPVIPVDKVVDPKRIIRKKMEGLGGGEAQGVADPKKHQNSEAFDSSQYKKQISDFSLNLCSWVPTFMK